MRDSTKIEATLRGRSDSRCLRSDSHISAGGNLRTTSQLRRPSYSVPANIVEGSSRESKKDYLHFLFIARGSLSETEYFLHLSKRLGFLADGRYCEFQQEVKATHTRLHGLIKAVEKGAGLLARASATITSAAALMLARLVST